MFFGQFSIEPVDGAPPLEKVCGRCSNIAPHVLVDQPCGIAVGIPFLRRPFWSSHRGYFLACPICGQLNEISHDAAQAMIRKGKPESQGAP
ncbi:hypothetical protein [Planctomyces sp. SH-PL14]|uniref:hypothetical protein n=1 Tax=Planctomyces sp. SH-PL14 TaxID=1632864 RepID=UPI00078B4298|nr:hypothetical protein [Planctomyces sp. SH-PL14]AMV16392.1 hypothetical protein VT03_00785 [Planctomyces sp. SH-PL14]